MKLKLLVLTTFLIAPAGCKHIPVTGGHARGEAVTPVTPEAYKQRTAMVKALWKERKITTTDANDQLWALRQGVKDYCEDHYCGP